MNVVETGVWAQKRGRWSVFWRADVDRARVRWDLSPKSESDAGNVPEFQRTKRKSILWLGRRSSPSTCTTPWRSSYTRQLAYDVSPLERSRERQDSRGCRRFRHESVCLSRPPSRERERERERERDADSDLAQAAVPALREQLFCSVDVSVQHDGNDYSVGF